MLKIALTGGIGSGKTLASDYLKSQGASIIDTDIISRELVEPGQAALSELQDVFGDNIISANGTLDRQLLRNMVFADSQKLKQLNSIMHPRIRSEMLRQAESSKGAYAVCVIPLLAETAQQHLFNRVLLIDSPTEVQISRICARDDINTEQANNMLLAQASRSQRQAIADDIVVNDGDREALYKKLEKVHQNYLTLAN